MAEQSEKAKILYFSNQTSVEKEAKILFLVPDVSGENLLGANAAGRFFSEISITAPAELFLSAVLSLA